MEDSRKQNAGDHKELRCLKGMNSSERVHCNNIRSSHKLLWDDLRLLMQMFSFYKLIKFCVLCILETPIL